MKIALYLGIAIAQILGVAVAKDYDCSLKMTEEVPIEVINYKSKGDDKFDHSSGVPKDLIISKTVYNKKFVGQYDDYDSEYLRSNGFGILAYKKTISHPDQLFTIHVDGDVEVTYKGNRDYDILYFTKPVDESLSSKSSMKYVTSVSGSVEGFKFSISIDGHLLENGTKNISYARASGNFPATQSEISLELTRQNQSIGPMDTHLVYTLDCSE